MKMADPKRLSFRKPIGTEFSCAISCLENDDRILRCIEKYTDSFTTTIFFYCKTHECYTYSSGVVFGFSLMFNIWIWNSILKGIFKKKLDKMKMKESESGDKSGCAKA